MKFPFKVRTCLFLEHEAEQAAEFYTSIVPDSTIEAVHRIEPTGQPLVVEFTLAGAPYMTLNGNPAPTSSHLSSISILTEDQDETNRLWEALLDGGTEGRCGWLQDRFGVHWQIVPKALPALLYDGDSDAAGRVFDALMAMSKIEICTLEAAYSARTATR